MAEPTAMPEPMEKPADEMMAGARHAPAFAEYWKPDTDFYGDPVYGGTLRINYEDPLEHANTWGASTGGRHPAAQRHYEPDCLGQPLRQYDDYP